MCRNEPADAGHDDNGTRRTDIGILARVIPGENRTMTPPFDATSTIDEVLSGVDLTGRRFLVTGTSAGIGLETARALVAHGALVVGAVRDLAKARAVGVAIDKSARKGGGRLDLVELNLNALGSVRACADALLADGRAFDFVITNAAVMMTPPGRTADGFETQFGVNHLGHFALVNAILPLLNDGARVLVSSSLGHRVSDVDLDDPNFERQAYDPLVAYARSKTANALFAVELDRRQRARGVRSASVMPGNSSTELARHVPKEALAQLMTDFTRGRSDAGLPPPTRKTPAQAAATSIWAAVIADADEIGGRYLEDCAVAVVDDSPSPFRQGVRSYALDPASAARLWDQSEELIAAAR